MHSSWAIVGGADALIAVEVGAGWAVLGGADALETAPILSRRAGDGCAPRVIPNLALRAAWPHFTDVADHVLTFWALADSSHADLSLGAGEDAQMSVPLVPFAALADKADVVPYLIRRAADALVSVPVLSIGAAKAGLAVPVGVFGAEAGVGDGAPVLGWGAGDAVESVPVLGKGAAATVGLA